MAFSTELTEKLRFSNEDLQLCTSYPQKMWITQCVRLKGRLSTIPAQACGKVRIRCGYCLWIVEKDRDKNVYKSCQETICSLQMIKDKKEEL